MKYKSLIIIFSCIFSLNLKAQFCATDMISLFERSPGDVYLSLHGGLRYDDDFLPKAYFGINPQIMLSPYVGLNYSFGFGKDYGHIPFFGGGAWSSLAASLDSDDAVCILVLLALMPEGFSFHIPINNQLKISPYINFMGSERLKNTYGDFTDTFRGSYNFGAQLMYNVDGTIVSPFIELGGLFSAPVKNWRTGMSIGWIL